MRRAGNLGLQAADEFRRRRAACRRHLLGQLDDPFGARVAGQQVVHRDPVRRDFVRQRARQPSDGGRAGCSSIRPSTGCLTAIEVMFRTLPHRRSAWPGSRPCRISTALMSNDRVAACQASAESPRTGRGGPTRVGDDDVDVAEGRSSGSAHAARARPADTSATSACTCVPALASIARAPPRGRPRRARTSDRRALGRKFVGDGTAQSLAGGRDDRDPPVSPRSTAAYSLRYVVRAASQSARGGLKMSTSSVSSSACALCRTARRRIEAPRPRESSISSDSSSPIQKWSAPSTTYVSCSFSCDGAGRRYLSSGTRGRASSARPSPDAGRAGD